MTKPLMKERIFFFFESREMVDLSAEYLDGLQTDDLLSFLQAPEESTGSATSFSLQQCHTYTPAGLMDLKELSSSGEPIHRPPPLLFPPPSDE